MILDRDVFHKKIELFQKVAEIHLSITKNTFLEVFDEWIQSLKTVIDTEDECVL